MEDLKIPGIVGAIISGLFGGTPLISSLGLLIFGPINGNEDIWLLIGAIFGVTFFLYYHFRKKKRTQQHSK